MTNYSLNTPYITVAGVVVIVIVAGFTVISPLGSDIQQARVNLLGLQASVAQKEEFLRNLDRKKEELQIQRVHEERLNVILPINDALDAAIRVINLAVTPTGATVQKITDKSAPALSALNARRSRGEPVAIPETVTPLAADVEITGTYQQLRAVLANLAKAPRLSDVTSLSLKRASEQSDQLTASLSIQFYRRSGEALPLNP